MYSIQRIPINGDFLNHATMLSHVLESGNSYDNIDSFRKLDCKFRGAAFTSCEEMERDVLENSGISKNSLMLTICKDKHYQRGTKVFCTECLKNNKRVRRLQGCKSENCWANNTKAKAIDTADISELENAHCCHSRQSSENWIYMMNPVGHITLLENTGLIDRLVNQYPSAIKKTIGIMENNGVFSPSLSFNTIFPFKELGEMEIVEELWKHYKTIINPQYVRNSLQPAVNNLLHENSIERRLY